MKKISLRTFILPFIVFLLLLSAYVLNNRYLFLITIGIGIFRIITDSYEQIRKKKYSLDYIAFVAMIVSILSDQYMAGTIIALMFTGGKALEAFAEEKAYAALKSLGDTIPKHCLVHRGETYTETPIQEIKNGEKILIKRKEIVPLDGVLTTASGGLFDLSNLTGEIDPVEFKTGTFIKSGSINAGDTVELSVVGDFSSSTYHKIVLLVQDARVHPAPIVRLSERANFYFTFAAFIFSVGAFLATGDISRTLAVLVIATPCPLIIAAPVAFIGGMSRLARKGIIMRKPSAFEVFEKASVIFFDKTGTLTMGEPILEKIQIMQKKDGHSFSENEILAIAAGIEVHSLHPLARALVHEAHQRKMAYPIAHDVKEHLGKGISGTLNGRHVSMTRATGNHKGIVLTLSEDSKALADFHFTDRLKEGASRLLETLQKQGIHTEVITGDKKENAEEVFKGLEVTIHAEASPEDKYRFIENAHSKHETAVMIGDGLNDAPALARADAGVVFSGTENGASIEAADVVILDHRIEKLVEIFAASKRTVGIARQSIYGGIALSTVGMAFAAFGHISPVEGAFIQEAIDIVVILNALRTLKS